MCRKKNLLILNDRVYIIQGIRFLRILALLHVVRRN